MGLDIPQLKLGNITMWYSTIFKTMNVVKNIWDIINTITSIWYENTCILRFCQVLDIICSSKLTELRSLQTVHFSAEQIMSTDRYEHIFSLNGCYCNINWWRLIAIVHRASVAYDHWWIQSCQSFLLHFPCTVVMYNIGILYFTSKLLLKKAWPSSKGTGLEIQRSEVQIPFWQPDGVVLGSRKFNSLVTI